MYSLYEGSWKGAAVSVKVLRCEINSSDAVALEAELIVLSQLTHSRLQNLLGVCHELSVLEGTVALIMEATGRGSLYDILHDSSIAIAPLNKCNRLRLAFDISDGMRFLHSLNIVHGDLKSGNIIVDHEGRAKIADFGMKSLNKQTWSHSRNMVSTLAWTAPEVMEHCGEVQMSGDVYSFGVILLELSTGQIPWEGKSAQQIMRSHIVGDRLTMPIAADENAASPVEEGTVTRCLGEVSGRPSFNELYDILSLLLSSEIGKKSCHGVPLSDAFLCPIGYEIMEDPVICSDGHTYERGNIEKWLLSSTRSPKTNLMLANRILIPNIVLKGLIRDSQHYAA